MHAKELRRLSGLGLHQQIVRPYPHRQPFFSGFAERIGLFAEVFLRHFVDVLVGASLGNLHNPSLYNEDVVWIAGIYHGDAALRIAPQVAHFLAALSGVEDDVVAVYVYPNRRDLGTPIRVHRRQVSDVGCF